MTAAATSSQAWISARGVAKSYGGVRALREADLDLHLNEVYGIIGPNGAGKSTFVKILAGAIRPDAGEVCIDGTTVELTGPSVAINHRLVLMPQELTFVPDFSVVENITLGSEPTRRGLNSVRQSEARARTALDTVGLDVNPRALASTLQPVEKRLLMLATAVNRRARLLILDEPTAGLPGAEARQVTDTVRRLREHGLTIVYVSHHLSEVAELSDHVICVREGAISARLSADEITKDALIEAIVGGVPADAVAAAGVVTVDQAVLTDAARPSPNPPGVQPAAPAPATGGPGPGASPPESSPQESSSQDSSSQDPDEHAGIALRSVSGSRLRDVSFVARTGEVTGVTGLLGSGVTEVVAIVSGASKPAAGEIRMAGTGLSLSSPADALRHGIGSLSGDRARSALATMSVRDNVSITALRKWFGRTGFIRRAQERARVDATLAALSVTGDPERPVSALSGGNQQRVLVCRLMAADLEVMIFDEPTIGVDIGSRAQLWREVRQLAKGRIVLLASTEPEELIALCDRVVCLHDGGVAAILNGPEITEHAMARAIS